MIPILKYTWQANVRSISLNKPTGLTFLWRFEQTLTYKTIQGLPRFLLCLAPSSPL